MSEEITRTSPKLGLRVEGNPQDGHIFYLKGEQVLLDIFGTKFAETAEALLGQSIRTLKPTEASDKYPGNDERTFLGMAVSEIEPRDGLEGMLAAQMAVTHVALMRSARWLAHAETVDQVNAHYNGYTKLTRAFAQQVEALRKYRNGGKQTVTVQHVNVGDGGQAIVGNVETGRGGNGEKRR